MRRLLKTKNECHETGIRLLWFTSDAGTSTICGLPSQPTNGPPGAAKLAFKTGVWGQPPDRHAQARDRLRDGANLAITVSNIHLPATALFTTGSEPGDPTRRAAVALLRKPFTPAQPADLVRDVLRHEHDGAPPQHDGAEQTAPSPPQAV
jgi:hypothetical protein